MTISTTTARVAYNGSGSTGPFSIPFYWTSSSEIVVTKTSSAGVESTLALTTHYTLTGSGTASGSATLLTALAVGETLVIERDTLKTQALNMERSGIDPETLEEALDKLTRIGQDHESRLDRGIELYKDDTDGTGAFNARSNKISNLDDGVANTDAATVGQIAPYATAAAASATAAAASATAAAADEASAESYYNLTVANYVQPSNSVAYTYVLLDDISASFNGSAVTFGLLVGAVAFTPLSAASLMVVLNGVVQEPGLAYTVSSSNITFTTAPAAGFDCFIIAQRTQHATVDLVPTSFMETMITTANSASAARTQLGSGATGDTLFQSASSSAARTTLGTRTSALDSIAASFDGVETTFNLTASAAAFTPRDVYGVSCIYNGVAQIPGSAYTISGSQITFTFTPQSGDTCALWAVSA